MEKKAPPPFELTSPGKGGKNRTKWFPDGLVDIAVATPLSEVITVMVTVEDREGKRETVPVVWSPTTNMVKRLHTHSWAELGIESGVGKIRDTVRRMARNEHMQRASRYATRDMFDDIIKE